MPAITSIARGLSELEGPKKNGLLVETIQIVESRKQVPVPNHLLESKIYSKVSQNATVQARPAVLHFGGFQVAEKKTVSLRIANVSSEVIRMHIIPPQTKYFDIHYTKNDRLVPGLTLDCQVVFTAKECRYYYDCIRINCPGEDNLVIPIHAYPVMDTESFPKQVDFPPVPVGQKRSKIFPLRCHVPVDFEFELRYLQHHPAFRVEPMSGIVPAHGQTNIVVTFAPSEFLSAYMKLQLVISQFNSTPVTCSFTGSSIPGLLKEKAKQFLQSDMESENDVLDPRCISPLDRARSKRVAQSRSQSEKEINLKSEEIEYEGLRFMPDLNTPYAVGQVLNQQKGKLRMKDLREAIAANKQSGPSTRQMKEALFEQAVRQDIYDERQNQLRWQVRLGYDQITAVDRTRIVQDRHHAWNEYRYNVQGEHVAKNEYNRLSSKQDFKRTWRDREQMDHNMAIIMATASLNNFAIRQQGPLPDDEEEIVENVEDVQPAAVEGNLRGAVFRDRFIREKFARLGSEHIKFDLYTNDQWWARHYALNRFSQAARKVIIQLRASKKLTCLADTALEWRKKKYAPETTAEQQAKLDNEEEFVQDISELSSAISLRKVAYYQFPMYSAPDVKDDMAPDALGIVPFKPTEVVVKKRVPFFDLKVPQQYRLLGYKPYNIHELSSNYVPPKLVRALRIGAQDELIVLPEDGHMDESPVIDDEVEYEAAHSPQSASTTSKSRISPQSKHVSIAAVLNPPEAMVKPVEYHPLHVFNPAPGLQIFHQPMPYSEVEPDFHLCPLPRYYRSDQSTQTSHTSTQRKYLDREHIIRGAMTWKKFPSGGLMSLGYNPTLSSAWVPRWSDPFMSEIMPAVTPPLMDSLQDDDMDNVIDNERDVCESDSMTLTPDMVNAEFPLITKSTEQSGEDKEQDIQQLMLKKFNRLGTKFTGRIMAMSHLCVGNNKNLVLK